MSIQETLFMSLLCLAFCCVTSKGPCHYGKDMFEGHVAMLNLGNGHITMSIREVYSTPIISFSSDYTTRVTRVAFNNCM